MMQFLAWLVKSSENPNNLSMTVKGFLTTVVSLVILLSPLLHYKADESELNAVMEGILQLILALSTVVSTIAGIVGLIRKIHLSGANPTELQTNPVDTKIGESPAPVVIVPPVE